VDVEEDSVIEGHVFRADPRILHVTVIDARRADRRRPRSPHAARGAGVRRRQRGFFDEKAEPLGLVVGEENNQPLRKVDQGVF